MEGIETEYSDDFQHRSRATGRLTSWEGGIWWQNFFREINFKLPEKMSIRCDNRQTIRLLTNESPQLTTKLRHVDIHHHWLRQEVIQKRVHIEWISTNEMPADGFTKAFTRQKHDHFLRLLNLRIKQPASSS